MAATPTAQLLFVLLFAEPAPTASWDGDTRGVWALASSNHGGGDLDCVKDNSPPCRCTRDAEAATVFAAATARDLPLPLATQIAGDASAEFGVLSHGATHQVGQPPCRQFALEISGAGGGVAALNSTAHRVIAASGGKVDVFAHLYAVRDPVLEMKLLERIFGPRLRAVTFERWGTHVEAHIIRVANGRNGTAGRVSGSGRGGGDDASGRLGGPAALDWLVNELSQRFSRRLCGAKLADQSPEMRCRKPWRTVLAHVLSMWRKVFLASEMRARHEREGGCRYDLVMRSRPDARPTRPLDLRRFAASAGRPQRTAHALCAGMGRRYCKQRAAVWPATACWADDQVALGDRDAMTAYARFFPEFSTFAWWYPLARADSWRHVSERLLGAHFDWRARSARALAGAREPFAWHVRQPDGKVDFGWVLDRGACFRCLSDKPIPPALRPSAT